MFVNCQNFAGSWGDGILWVTSLKHYNHNGDFKNLECMSMQDFNS